MTKPTISKSQFLKGKQCQKALWYYRNRKDLKQPIDAKTQAKFDMGNEVGEIAKACFEGGVEVKDEYWETEKAIHSTNEFIKQGHDIIFEATAIHPVTGVFSKIDVLRKVPDTDEWDLIEVKSSKNIKPYHIDDVSFQYHVFHHAGYKIRQCFLMLLDGDYVRQGDIDPHGLLRLEDITKKVLGKQVVIDNLAAQLAIVPTQENEPTIAIGSHCSTPFECDYKQHCWKHIPEYSIYKIFKKEKVNEIHQTIGSYDINDIPVNLYPKNAKGEINLTKKIDIESYKSGVLHVEKEGINSFLNELEYPLYYLDYETVSYGIPVYDGTSPHQAMPFQFSLHIQKELGAELTHIEFLHQEPTDPRKALTEALISNCGDKGSVIVYHQSTEENVNKKLAILFPQYKDELDAINTRMVDLLIPFRQRYLYSSKQKSSCSIKDVLPAYFPNDDEHSYENKEIADGLEASRRYLEFVHGKLDGKQQDELWSYLYEYCGLDTMAMVKLVDLFNNYNN